MRTDPSIIKQRAPLRIGVLTAGSAIPGWAGGVLDDIDACAVAEIAGFVVADSRRPRGAMARIRTGGSRALYELYRRVDARRFAAPVDPPDEIDLSERLARLPVVSLASGAEAISRIASWDLDVIVGLGGVAPNAILGCARHGVWSYRYGDPDGYGGGPPLFWEMYDGAPVATSVLERVTGAGRGEVIYRSFSAIDPISLHRARRRVYRKSTTFVARKLRDVHRDGGVSTDAGDRSYAVAASRRAPTNRQMLCFGWKLGTRLARRVTRNTIAHQQWFLAYQRRGDGLPSAATLRGATVLAPPRDRFYADPCLVDWRGSTYLFLEQFDFTERKGVIACSRLTPDGRFTPPQVVLERPYHLSYPYVFLLGEEAFMLPEAAASGAIELYKAHSFPTGWALDSVLVTNVRAVDPTLIEHDGRYWLFANTAVEGASNDDELSLFCAEALRGPWEPHPRNPVVSDVRRARPAGRPFVDEAGRLIRPSQDCSGLYGSAVVFSCIEELSAAAYREAPVGRLGSNWRSSNLGTHTYSRSQHWEAVDGRAWVRRRS